MSACFTQSRTAVSVRSRSRATLAAVLPGWRTSATTSALNSLVKDRRGRFVRPIVSIVDILSRASPLIVDVRQTGSGPMTHGNSRLDPTATSVSSRGSIVTAELDMRRINVRTEEDIVVDFSTG
jgi:hypothetical protein